VASTCATSLVPMPKANAPNAPWVLVWLSPQTTVVPGSVSPISGPITWTIPCCSLVSECSSMPNRAQFSSSAASWAAALAVLYQQARARAARRGRRGVIHGGDREVRPAHGQPSLAQHREGLRRGDLVHQVQIDVQHRRSVLRLGRHQVSVPDLLEQRPGVQTAPQTISGSGGVLRWRRPAAIRFTTSRYASALASTMSVLRPRPR